MSPPQILRTRNMITYMLTIYEKREARRRIETMKRALDCVRQILVLSAVLSVAVGCAGRPTPPTLPDVRSNLVSVVGVLPVEDHAVAVKWYQKWIGRAPDVAPMEGVAEWQLAPNAWIQVSVDSKAAGRSSVVVGVNDVDAQRSACAAVGVAVGEVKDYGFVKTAEAIDPAGKKLLFVQEVPQR